MTHEQIIQLSREAGLSFVPEANSPLVKIVMRAVEMEREACAQKVFGWNTAITDVLAKEIRERGKE